MCQFLVFRAKLTCESSELCVVISIMLTSPVISRICLSLAAGLPGAGYIMSPGLPQLHITHTYLRITYYALFTKALWLQAVQPKKAGVTMGPITPL